MLSFHLGSSRKMPMPVSQKPSEFVDAGVAWTSIKSPDASMLPKPNFRKFEPNRLVAIILGNDGDATHSISRTRDSYQSAQKNFQ